MILAGATSLTTHIHCNGDPDHSHSAPILLLTIDLSVVQNRRPDYIESFVEKLINWDKVIISGPWQSAVK